MEGFCPQRYAHFTFYILQSLPFSSLDMQRKYEISEMTHAWILKYNASLISGFKFRNMYFCLVFKSKA